MVTHDGTADDSTTLQYTDFGFAIPAAATLDGIAVALTHSEEVDGLVDSVYMLLSGGTKSTSAIPNTLGVTTFGGPTDKWSVGGPSIATINSSTWGVQLYATLAGEPTPGDYNGYRYDVVALTITVYYTVAGQALRVSRVPLNSFVQGSRVP